MKANLKGQCYTKITTIYHINGPQIGYAFSDPPFKSFRKFNQIVDTACADFAPQHCKIKIKMIEVIEPGQPILAIYKT